VATFISGKKLDQSQLLDGIYEGSIPLTAVVEISALHKKFIYQLSGIDRWVMEQVEGYKFLLPEKVQAKDLQEQDWYLQRGSDIFGPLTLSALAHLNHQQHTTDTDLCFSIKLHYKMNANSLAKILSGTMPEQNFHVNRKYRRLPTHFKASLLIEGQNFPVVTANISEGGAAIMTKSTCEVGKKIQFIVWSFESVPEFRCEATVISSVLKDGLFQLGLEFSRLSKSESKILFEHDKKSISRQKAG
jgi:hypothetical protein